MVNVMSWCGARTFAFMLMAGLGASLSSAQSLSDFVISSPEFVIQLVRIEQHPAADLRFTFKNVSSKTILEICISAPLKWREMDCMDGFANGAKLPAPGDIFSMGFDANGFSLGQENPLRVNAVVFTDGSHIGEAKVLVGLEDAMFGVALETKRISDLLSNCPDGSVTGLDSVLLEIGTSAPSTSAEAASELEGESLPGISESQVDAHLGFHTRGLLEGVSNALDMIHQEIDQEKTIATSPLSGGPFNQKAVLEARSHGLSDLAQKYRLLSQSQISYLASYLASTN